MLHSMLQLNFNLFYLISIFGEISRKPIFRQTVPLRERQLSPQTLVKYKTITLYTIICPYYTELHAEFNVEKSDFKKSLLLE